MNPLANASTSAEEKIQYTEINETGVRFINEHTKEDSNPDWPRDALTGEPMKDAYDICIDLLLGWNSGELVHYRNATVPECWDGHLDIVKNRCVPEKPK